MIEREFPILEFDADKNAIIRPKDCIRQCEAPVPERAVLCFFGEALKKLVTEREHSVIFHFSSESMRLPLYALEYEGERIALMQAAVGAPLAAGQIEELTQLGCRKFIACGGCGVLQKEIAVGHLILPVSAVRDEGTSYHYAAPSREIQANARVLSVLERTLMEGDIPYIKAKTWTTDAFYRETPEKLRLRKREGCVCVEMEASAYMAAAQYNGVEFGQILYAGDNLGGEEWDSRDFNRRTEIREMVLRLALNACLKL